jgi:hypothetical protein
MSQVDDEGLSLSLNPVKQSRRITEQPLVHNSSTTDGQPLCDIFVGNADPHGLSVRSSS